MIQTIEVEGRTRWIVPFNDNDGLVVLLDDEANLRRYQNEEFDYDVDRLRQLNGLGEVCPFGTHGGEWKTIVVLALDTEFSEGELAEYGMIDALDGGILTLTSSLVVTDWAHYTFANSCNNARVDGARLDFPSGNYRVTIHRSYQASDEQPGDLYMIELRRTADAPSELETLPGNDGWF